MKESMILVIMLFMGAILWMEQRKFRPKDIQNIERDTEVSKGLSTSEKNKIVSQHLAETEAQIKFAEEQAKIRNHFQAPKVGTRIEIPFGGGGDSDGSRRSMKLTHPSGGADGAGLDFSEDRTLKEARETMSDKPHEPSARAASDMIYSEMAERIDAKAYEHEYIRAYIRQYIENARRNGYDVVVDDNLEITRIQPIHRSNAN